MHELQFVKKKVCEIGKKTFDILCTPWYIDCGGYKMTRQSMVETFERKGYKKAYDLALAGAAMVDVALRSEGRRALSEEQQTLVRNVIEAALEVARNK